MNERNDNALEVNIPLTVQAPTPIDPTHTCEEDYDLNDNLDEILDYVGKKFGINIDEVIENNPALEAFEKEAQKEASLSAEERLQQETKLRFEYECHTWHKNTISDYGTPEVTLEQLQLLAETTEPVPCRLDLDPETQCSATGEYTSTTAQVALVGDCGAPLRFIRLLAQPQGAEAPFSEMLLPFIPLVLQRIMTHRLNACYPECDGTMVTFKLREIHEWTEGLEATLVGEVVHDNGYLHRIAFFDTRYALNKQRYQIGETYSFSLSALAYFTFQHEDFYEASLSKNIFSPWSTMGLPPKLLHFYAENFNFEGVIEAFSTFEWNETEFYQLHLDLFAGAWDALHPETKQYIPLYVKGSTLRDFSPNGPTQGQAIIGKLWLQGRLIEADDVPSAVN